MSENKKSGSGGGKSSKSPRYSDRYGPGHVNPYMGGQPKHEVLLREIENRQKLAKREAEEKAAQRAAEEIRAAEQTVGFVQEEPARETAAAAEEQHGEAARGTVHRRTREVGAQPRAMSDPATRERLRQIQRQAMLEARGLSDDAAEIADFDDEPLASDVKLRLSEDNKPLIALEMRMDDGSTAVRWVPVVLSEKEMEELFPAIGSGKADAGKEIELTQDIINPEADQERQESDVQTEEAEAAVSDNEAEETSEPTAEPPESEEKEEENADTAADDTADTADEESDQAAVEPEEEQAEPMPAAVEMSDAQQEPETEPPTEEQSAEEESGPDDEDRGEMDEELAIAILNSIVRENNPSTAAEEEPTVGEDNGSDDEDNDKTNVPTISYFDDDEETDIGSEEEQNGAEEDSEELSDEAESEPEPESESETSPESEKTDDESADDADDEDDGQTEDEPQTEEDEDEDIRIADEKKPREPEAQQRRMAVAARPVYDDLNVGTRYTQSRYVDEEQDQDDSLFLRKERPGSTTLFVMPDGVKLPKYIDDDDFVERWLGEKEDEDMATDSKRRRRRISTIVGALTMVLALVGLIAIARWGIDMLGGIGNTDSQKTEYAEFISPVVMSEVPAFETWDAMPQDKLLQSAVFSVLLDMEVSYERDDTGKFIVPSTDVVNAVKKLYGAYSDDAAENEDIDTKIRNALYLSAGEDTTNTDVYYVDMEDSFHVADGLSGPSPQVVDIARRDNTVTLTVEYLEDLEIGSGGILYSRQFILTLDDSGYYVQAVREIED